MNTSRPLITFDLFSALIDSRRGGGAFLRSLAAERDWPVDGEDIYNDWDVRNKQAQAHVRRWVPFARVARGALKDTYQHFALRGDASSDCARLLASVADWPLWPDVESALTALEARYRIGILSNVDDDILATTKVSAFIDSASTLTSQRLRSYKPGKRIYELAHDQFGVRLHIAASARDVRGAGEASLPVVRIARPGHDLDRQGPAPTYTVGDLRDLDRVALMELGV